jgi:Ca2+-binding RTX toxin-like protein
MVSSVLAAGLTTVYQQLTAFAGLESFWTNFDSIFGTAYNIAVAQSLRSQWQSGNFSQLPTIEVIDDEVLGNARGAYASSTNIIYLSDQFVETASPQALEAVILEEIGHFVDAQVNNTDTAWDEGELFSAVVRGVGLSAAELSRIKTENDWATLSLNGNLVPVELSSADPNYPWITGNYDTPGDSLNLQIVGNLAYIADGNSLQIIDISNPAFPTFKGSYGTPSYAHDVKIVGNLAYIADYYSGLQIIDITNPASPTLKGSYSISHAFDVQIVGNFAYITNSSSLQIIDISNPASPFFKGSYGTSDIADNVQIIGNLAYIANSGSGLKIVDISDLEQPTFKGGYDTPGDSWDLQIVSNFAYIADFHSLQIIDISNPTSPTFKGSYDTPGTAVGVEIVGNLAYIADGVSGLQIIDISNPAKPTFKGSYDTPGDALKVQIVGNLAYITDESLGLQIIDISNLPPFKGSYDTPGNTQDVQIVGNLAYIADGDSGLQIIDISNPALPTPKGSYDTPGNAYDVQIVGNLAYVADQSSVQIIDISNPTAPILKGSYSSQALEVQIVGNLAYVICYANYQQSGLQIIDISNPAQPTFKGSYNTPEGVASSLTIVGSFAYIADNSSGLKIIDISNPTAPTLKGSYDTPGNAYDVQIVGNLAYVADLYSLQIIDISNPAQPTLKGSYDTLDYAFDVEIVGTLAYITGDFGNYSGTNGISGVQIIDITNPVAPTFKAFYGTPGRALGVEVAGNNVYVSSDTDGISIFGAYSPGTTLSLAPTNASQIEGNSGSKTLTFTVTRTGNTTATNTVNWVVTGTGTNPANATDFVGGVLPSGTVTFAANSTSQVISVSVNGDTTVEPNETFNVNLFNPNNGAALSTATATGTITNDDLPSINLSPNGQTVVEGLTTPQNLSYTVSLSGSSPQTITVQYSTANGTALAGSDYTATTGTLTFNPGVTSQTISIPILNDSVNEANETFTVKLTSPTNAILGGTATVTTTITDTLSASTTTTLPANVENLTLTGSSVINGTGNAGNNILTGNTANNTLNGGDGNDTLNGGTGNDTLIGGLGNDVYQVDSTTDVITENANEGTDTIQSSVTFSLATFPNIENLTLTGSSVIDGTGNTANNSLTGNTANNTLNGGDGNDTLNGGAGNDTLNGGNGNDFAYYYSSTGSVTVNLATGIASDGLGGTDTLSQIENVQGSNTAGDNLTGNTGNNVLYGYGGNDILNGGDGNDTLNGGTGNDTLIGGLGNDVYQVDSTTDVITENSGQGTDTIQSSVTYTIASLANIENLTLTGSSVIDGTGNTVNNSLTGNTANNTLNGGDGNDTLNGGAGNDSLIGGNGNDFAYYYSSTGSVTVNLATGTASDGLGGTDTLSQIENIQGSNTASDNLTGNTGVNILYGYGGADILTGGGGNDLLYVGSDTVKDTVNYTSGDGIDTVYNFVRGVGGDILKFTSITAIDVQVSGSNTLFKVGDGISGNTGFGSGTLLLTTSATTGFTATDIGVNLFNVTNSVGFFFS